MTKEEMLAELIENCTWDVHSGHIFVTDAGDLQLPYPYGCEGDFVHIPVSIWIKRNADEDDLSDLPEEDFNWIVDKITKYFADKYEWYLQRQLMQLEKING